MVVQFHYSSPIDLTLPACWHVLLCSNHEPPALHHPGLPVHHEPHALHLPDHDAAKDIIFQLLPMHQGMQASLTRTA